MSTSGTYTFGVTRDDIIRQALLNIKRLDPDEAPTASETQDCARMLNMMCKQWQGKADFAPGLKVWTRKRGFLLLSNSTGAYTIGPGQPGWANSMVATSLGSAAGAGASTITVASAAGITSGGSIAIQQDGMGSLFYTTVSGAPVGTTVTLAAPMPQSAASGNAVFFYSTTAQNPRVVETAILRDFDNSDTPLRVMTVQSYDYLPNKADPTNVGDPTAIYVEQGLSTTNIYTDVGAAQDVSKRIVLTYQEPVQDFNNPLDEPYYPQEWYLALCWGLTEQIAPMFAATWNDKMEQLKNSALAIARNQNAERSELYFQSGAED